MTLHSMSLDQSDRVLGALDILCNVRWQALQPHRTKARLALQKLQVFIRNHDSSESSPSAKSNDGPASPSDRSHFRPRSISDNNDRTSPHHSDSPRSPSKSHDPLSAPHSLGYPSTLSSSLGLRTVSGHFDASKAFPVEHDLPPSCSLLLPAQSQHNYLASLNHPGHLSSLPNFRNARSSSNCSKSPPPFPDNRERPLDDHNSLPHHKNTLALIQALNKDQGKIQKYLDKSKVAAIEGKSSWTQEDPRVVDLQIGRKQTSLNFKFRRLLSRRSLTQEYDRWELQTYQTSRINQLVENLSDSKERADGHIKEYVDANANRFKNRDLAQHGIQCGIRLLVFERLLGESGSSAILCFSFHRFRSLNLPELECLRQEVRDTPWIWRLAKEKSSWLGNCQIYYDGIVDSRLSSGSVVQKHVPSKRCFPAPESSGKRPRLGQYNHRNVFRLPSTASAAWHEQCSTSGLSLEITGMLIIMKTLA